MDVVTEYRRLKRDGCLEGALEVARRRLPAAGSRAVAQIGQWLRKDLAGSGAGEPGLRVLVLGQCTTTYLVPALVAWSWHEGLRVECGEGAYDQVIQELARLEGDAIPDVVVILPWHQRLLADDSRDAASRVEDEMAFLQTAWREVARIRCKLIQVSYDWTGAGALGLGLSARRGGAIGLVQQANASLRAALPAGAFFVDLESLSAWHGKAGFYDERNDHWLKQPFTPEGLSHLARQTAAGLRTLTRGRRKVLVLDLDNTLWGGVVGEEGAHGVAIGGTTEGEAFAAFQRLVRQLRGSGVLLAVCSKNNEADAREPFLANDGMLLKLEDFSAFHASWDGKPSRIRRIAEELNLGLDSFVFFDDNPAEREHVRAELPEVLVVEVPPDPAHYLRALQESRAFEAVDLTSADVDRAGQYAAEAARRRLQNEGAAPERYLASLAMRAAVEEIDERNLDRVVDLITKTNQFNLTTRRHSRAAVEAMVSSPRSVCFAVKLADRFGDYGLISVLLGIAEDPETLRIDTWLMSCRAMGRTVEHFVMNHLAAFARDRGYATLMGEYLPTAKNAPVEGLLPGFGFVPAPGDGSRWTLSLTSFVEQAIEILPSWAQTA